MLPVGISFYIFQTLSYVIDVYRGRVKAERNIAVIGGYDARKYDISDENFIDFMHLDKMGTRIVWESRYS